jgi:hypothetical protein
MRLKKSIVKNRTFLISLIVPIVMTAATAQALDPTVAPYSIPNVTTGGGTSYSFTVHYADDGAIDVGSLDNDDIRVTGPGGFDVAATFVSYSGGGSSINATYSIIPPGGSWDAADNGTYTVVMQANQVFDSIANPVHPGNIGSFQVTVSNPSPTPAFFTGQIPLGNGIYYLQFTNGNIFGYYSYLADPRWIFHFDMGYEYWFDANDGQRGIFFYDFMSGHFFYTSPSFPFPYLYDFSLSTLLYYYPDPNNPGRYTTNPRYFYDFATGQIITM